MSAQSYTSARFWEWVNSHLGQDAARLRLASHPATDFNLSEAITQVECRSRYGKKLRQTLTRFPEFYFPSTLSGEQSTSDLLANFHANFVGADDNVVDLTSGLGIDALHMATKARHVTAIEQNSELCQALEYNAKGLKTENLKVVCGDCTELIDKLSGTVAYIDPARRAADGSRVFGLNDCQPDVTTLIPELSRNFRSLIIKASPMLDISRTIAELGTAVTDIYLIGTTTECKELFAILRFGEEKVGDVNIHAVTLFGQDAWSEFPFTREQEAEAMANIAEKMPMSGDILYVPYPATMKAAPTKLLSSDFGLNKFHANTHLYFGAPSNPVENFPGEKLEIVEVIPWQSKNIKRFKSRFPNVMVSTRNFGMSAEALRKKLGVKEGGAEQLRLFGIGLGNDHTDKILIVARPYK